MNDKKTFRTGEPSLKDILRDISAGEIQLPDFQRDWVWNDSHICSLIASVSLFQPIGAIMLLETGGEGAKFQPRLFSGVKLTNIIEPKYLVLDGQQRLTSLYLAVKSTEVVKTKNDKGDEIERFYYLDIKKAIDPNEDRTDAILSAPANRQIKSDFGRKIELDLSSQEKEYENGMFPINILFDDIRYTKWRREYNQKYRTDNRRLDEFDAFESLVIDKFKQYDIACIELLKGTPKEAVCQIFEKVNTGGVSLTVFELMTAIFAADNFNLRKDWETRSAKFHDREQLKDVSETDYLTALTLLASYYKFKNSGPAISCKRKDILKLELHDYKKYADPLDQGFVNAAKLLYREKLFTTYDLPYQTQLIPMAVVCTVLGDRFETDTIKQKILRWYWCGVFGELYGAANETRYAFDVTDVISWVEGGEEPRTVRDSNFAPTRLLSMQSRLSAAYKGVMINLLKCGSEDFINGDPIEVTNYFDDSIDIHHIFPKDYCEKEKLPRSKWNSIVNKTPLTAKTNRKLGGKAPSDYLEKIEKAKKVDTGKLEKILKTHLIDIVLLRSDNFEDFIVDRAKKILDLIEKATGKPIAGRNSDETKEAFGKIL